MTTIPLTLDADNDLEGYMAELGARAKQAAKALRLASSEQKTKALSAMAAHIRNNEAAILAANKIDMDKGEAKGLSLSLIHI